jgi:uncharacterized iron-regulated protein
MLFAIVSSASSIAIYESETGEQLSLKELSEKLAAFDVIFFGEVHDDSLIHELEWDILPIFFEDVDSLAIGMEMFERDVQSVVDAYLKSEIPEDEFIETSRAWNNYNSDYRPIVEFAKSHNIPIIATNVPRRYASTLAQEGVDSLYNVPEEEHQYFAEELNVFQDEYKDRFMETITMHMKAETFTKEMREKYQNYYAAQCLKDDTMAESIANFLSEYPETTVLHYNGMFHSDAHLGIVQKLAIRKPDLEIAVIAPILIEDDTQPLTFPEARKGEGDFLLVKHYEVKEE